MGLDMYLNGRVDSSPEASCEELGYWRKHANLHGYIVQTFANGVDECQEIPLSIDDLKKIVVAVKESQLPFTTGFFFGQSFGDEAPEDIRIFANAIAFLEQNGPSASVCYQASW